MSCGGSAASNKQPSAGFFAAGTFGFPVPRRLQPTSALNWSSRRRRNAPLENRASLIRREGSPVVLWPMATPLAAQILHALRAFDNRIQHDVVAPLAGFAGLAGMDHRPYPNRRIRNRPLRRDRKR